MTGQKRRQQQYHGEIPVSSAAIAITCYLLTFNLQRLTALGTTACSGGTIKERIVGGAEATPHSHPHQLALYLIHKASGSRRMCGAVLISPSFALTVAHCTEPFPLGTHYLTLSSGRHVLSRKNEATKQDRNATKVFTHREFRSVVNDIALLEFQPFILNEATKPIKLPDSTFKIDLEEGPKGTVTGWGCTTDEHCRMSDKLREVQIPLLDNKDCKKYYEGISDSMICAAEAEGGKDSCQGDSGGPMSFEQDGEKILIGLVSWGKGCACKGQPGVYTRITSFLTWIEDGLLGKLPPDDVLKGPKPTDEGEDLSNLSDTNPKGIVLNVCTILVLAFLII